MANISLEALDSGDIVQSYIQIPQFFHMMQVFQLRNDIVLQIEDAKLATQSADDLDSLQFTLVQADLFQVTQQSIIVL